MDFVLIEDRIGQAYSTPELNHIVRDHLLPFIRLYPETFTLKGVDLGALSRVSIPRKQLVRALAALVSDSEVMAAWLSRFSGDVRETLRVVASEGPISLPELEARIGCRIMERRGRTMQLQKTFVLLKHRIFRSFWGAEGNMDFIELPPIVRNLVRESLGEPDSNGLDGAPNPPEGASIFRDNGDVFKNLTFFARFLSQGELQKTSQGLPKAGSLIRLRNSSGLSEFYDRSYPTEISCLRTRLIIELLRRVQVSFEPAAGFQYLQELMEAYLKPGEFPFVWFFSHVRGMVHCRAGMDQGLHRRYWKLLEMLPDNGWITVAQIVRLANLTSLDLSPVDLKCADRYLYITTEWKGWGNKKRYLTPRLYEDVLVTPLLKASLFLFGSLGFLDLAYRPPENGSHTIAGKSRLTVFDGLEAVRLTEVGAAITGRSKAVQSQEHEPLSFELDAERLHIACSSADPIADITLQPYAEKISPRRFRVDEATFLKSCNSPEALHAKIDRFKKETAYEMPAVWDRFFQRLVERSDMLQPVDDMLVYRLSVREPGDLEAIATDRVLKHLIIKAEGRYVLVGKDKIQSVKKRLAELGYLM